MSRNVAFEIILGYTSGWFAYNGMLLSDLIPAAADLLGVSVDALAHKRRQTLRRTDGMPVITSEMVAMFGPSQLLMVV